MRIRRSIAAAALVPMAAMIATATSSAATSSAASADDSQEPVVIASGLNNPRQMTVGPDGNVYVAEAGDGGPYCYSGGPQPGGTTCVGASGALARVDSHDVTPVVTGVISQAGADGTFAVGGDAVGATRDSLYTLVTTLGPTPPSVVPPDLGRQFGKLLRAPIQNGRLRIVADVAANYYDNPVATLPPNDNSDPYGLFVLNDHTQFATDAAASLFLEVNGHTVTRVYHFPHLSPTIDFVPTSIAQGPDGALYIGQLTGDGAVSGQASVYRWVPGQTPTMWATGFTNITGLAFGPDGSLYVAEFQSAKPSQDPAGDVVRVDRRGNRTRIGVGSLFLVGGVAVKGDTLYVSNWSGCPGVADPADACGGATGQVVSFDVDPVHGF